MSATVVGTAHTPQNPATKTLGRHRREPENALQRLDLDQGAFDSSHRGRYTTSTYVTLATSRSLVPAGGRTRFTDDT